MPIENDNHLESVDTPQESQEQLAAQKYDEIINKIFEIWKHHDGSSYTTLDLKRADGALWWMGVADDWYWNKSLEIMWTAHNWKPDSLYCLSKEWEKYSLTSGAVPKWIPEDENMSITDAANKNTIDNVSSEELLNKILPNFEKRLNEWKMLQSQQRQKALEDADQYAYQQDQQDAYKLLQQNWQLRDNWLT